MLLIVSILKNGAPVRRALGSTTLRDVTICQRGMNGAENLGPRAVTIGVSIEVYILWIELDSICHMHVLIPGAQRLVLERLHFSTCCCATKRVFGHLKLTRHRVPISDFVNSDA